MPFWQGLMPEKRPGYRADVDGLRALAVLVILAFHLDVPGFAGGFVGVDIFFVISGYVILRRALPEIEAGLFSWKNFYERRLRRIAPGLLAVMAATLIGGAFLLGTGFYQEASESVLASLLFVPNFFFHDRSGYFAGAAYEKPLLHLWSLGIEEQFYLLMPPLLVLAAWWGKLRLGAVLAGVTLLSLVYCLIATPLDTNHAFYMPMARLWEIGAGGLVALAEAHHRPRRREALAWALFGFVSVMLALFTLDSNAAFPGFAALLPVMGTAFLIYAGAADASINPVSRLLAAPPMVALGVVSYALYLVHWPMIVFTRMALSRPLTGAEKAVMAAAIIAAAFLLWRLVEKPFRKSKTGLALPRVLKMLGGAALFIALASAAVSLSGGWPSRLSDEARMVRDLLDVAEKSKPVCTPERDLVADVHHKQHVCLYGPADDLDHALIVWGDSHAGVYAPALGAAAMAQGYSALWMGFPDCAPLRGVEASARKNQKGCAAFVEEVLAFVRRRGGGTVVLASRWANMASSVRAPGDGEASRVLYDLEHAKRRITLAEALDRTLKDLTQAGAQVVVLGPVPEIEFDVPEALMRTANGLGGLPDVPRDAFDERQREVMQALGEAERIPNVRVVYPHKALCNARRCEVAEGAKALYTDDDHLSLYGVDRVLPDIGRAMEALAGR